MNRADLKKLALERLEDARVLLDGGQFSGAYYVCGYAIECALKACIAKRTKRHDFPDKNFAHECFTHDISQLVKLGGLKPALDLEIANDSTFEVNWTVVKDWSAQSRYQIHTEQKARNLYSAVSHRRHGVLRWLKHHW